MQRTCEKCGGFIAQSGEDYDVLLGCECPILQEAPESEDTDEEPEECTY